MRNEGLDPDAGAFDQDDDEIRLSHLEAHA